MNGTGNNESISAKSVPQYEVVDREGGTHGPFPNAMEAALFASRKWPNQDQDERRLGHGWDVQVVGAGQ